MTLRLRRRKTWQDHAREAVSSAWSWVRANTSRRTAVAAGGAAAAAGTAAVVAATRSHGSSTEPSPAPTIDGTPTPTTPASIA